MARFIFKSSDIAMFLTLAVYFVLDFPPGSLVGKMVELGVWPSPTGIMPEIPALPQAVQVALIATLLATSLYGHFSSKTES